MQNGKKTGTLRIASYNIRKTRGLDQVYDGRRTIGVINQIGADVIALQEADHRLGQRPAALPRELIERETDYKIVPAASNEVSVGWHGNAVLVRRDVEIASVRNIDLPGLEPRGAVQVTVNAGLPFSVVATHLGLLRRHRRTQLSAIVDALGKADRTVILGDFNEWSERQGLEALHPRFEVLAPGKSFHAARPIAALDRIAVTRNIDVVDAGVVETKVTKRASDHLPIWANIEFQSAANDR